MKKEEVIRDLKKWHEKQNKKVEEAYKEYSKPNNDKLVFTYGEYIKEDTIRDMLKLMIAYINNLD